MELTKSFERISKTILSLSGVAPENIYPILESDSSLNAFEKSIVYYRFNPIIIKDGELPEMIANIRRSRNDLACKGFLGHSPEEQIALWQALQSAQYKRYMLHIMYSYKSTKNVHPLDGTGEHKCQLCGKPIYEHHKWWTEIVPQVPQEDREKEWLCWFSDHSDTELCLDCIAQLKYLTEMTKIVEPELLGSFWAKTRI